MSSARQSRNSVRTPVLEINPPLLKSRVLSSVRYSKMPEKNVVHHYELRQKCTILSTVLTMTIMGMLASQGFRSINQRPSWSRITCTMLMRTIHRSNSYWTGASGSGSWTEGYEVQWCLFRRQVIWHGLWAQKWNKSRPENGGWCMHAEMQERGPSHATTMNIKIA